MIHYQRGCFPHYFTRVCSLKGSVFPRAVSVALPNAIFTMVFRLLLFSSDYSPEAFVLITNNGIWTSFNYILGFLIVFRTSQGYLRLWEGVAQAHAMRSNWVSTASALCAFCKASKSDARSVMTFKHTLVRLISIMHAVALSELEDKQDTRAENVRAFNIEVIDASGLDDESKKLLRDSNCRVELMYQWIQELIVENIGTGVLSIPPPILSRSLQELGIGLHAFYQAMKIACVPFPFPYAQSCDVLLMIQWLLVPMVSVQWTETWAASGTFSFMLVLITWSMNLIAVDIENPFGSDANDLEFNDMQSQMNQVLVMLLRGDSHRVPTLSSQALSTAKAIVSDIEELEMTVGSTLCGVWVELGEDVQPKQSCWGTSQAKLQRVKEAKKRKAQDLKALRDSREMQSMNIGSGVIDSQADDNNRLDDLAGGRGASTAATSPKDVVFVMKGPCRETPGFGQPPQNGGDAIVPKILGCDTRTRPRSSSGSSRVDQNDRRRESDPDSQSRLI